MAGAAWTSLEHNTVVAMAAAGDTAEAIGRAIGKTARAVHCYTHRKGVQWKPAEKLKDRNPRLHGIWSAMKTRCTNPRQRGWSRYGGRGIVFCAAWSEFRPFMEWAIGSGYSDAMTLDRVDVNGNYEPSNCRWIPLSENISLGFRDRKRDGRGGCRLNTRQAGEIKALVGSGALTRAEAAEVYDVSYSIVKKIDYGTRWADAIPDYRLYAG